MGSCVAWAKAEKLALLPEVETKSPLCQPASRALSGGPLGALLSVGLSDRIPRSVQAALSWPLPRVWPRLPGWAWVSGLSYSLGAEAGTAHSSSISPLSG